MKLLLLCFFILFNQAISSETKDLTSFRIYDESSPEHVKNFYLQNHTHQTLNFVLKKKSEYLGLNRSCMSVWDAMALFDQIIDASDPDLDLPQRYHLFQTAEALRNAGKPRWMILTGLIHDLGKLLICYGEPQWAVVGDTFPLGCAFSDKLSSLNTFNIMLILIILIIKLY